MLSRLSPWGLGVLSLAGSVVAEAPLYPRINASTTPPASPSPTPAATPEGFGVEGCGLWHTTTEYCTVTVPICDIERCCDRQGYGLRQPSFCNVAPLLTLYQSLHHDGYVRLCCGSYPPVGG